MTSLFAAIDESTDGYYAIVIGDEIAINKNTRLIPKGFEHMTRYYADHETKKKIVDSFDFDCNIFVACIKFGLPKLKKQIEEKISSGKCRIPKTKVSNTIGYEMVRTIQSLCRIFVTDNGVDVRSITFEIDNIELHNYLKVGLTTTFKQDKTIDVHTIADCIAYANYKGWALKYGGIELHDLNQNLSESVFKEMKKK